MSCHLYSRRN